MNITSPALADLNGDGWPDNSIEVRSGPDDVAIHENEPWENRDMTSGLPRGGWAAVMDGRTGQLLQVRRQALTLGPGPLSTFFGAPGHVGWSVLTNTSTPTRVNAYGRHGSRTWTRTLDVYPQPWQTLSPPTGPVFVTSSGIGTGPAAVPGAVGRVLVSALDGTTGRTRWEKSFKTTPGSFKAYATGGDLILHSDDSPSQVTRVDGSTGAVRWSHPYVDRLVWEPEAPRDFNGDGVSDVLERDDPQGAVILDGRDGTVRPVPVLNAFTFLFPVDDLDGDGADDFAAVLGTYFIVGAPERAAGGVEAISGKTGLPLWTAPMIPSSDSVDIVSASFDPGKPADLIVHRDATDLTRLDGRDGHRVWTRAAP